jgi:DNA-binding PadR family transcriptional regulator
MNSRWTLTVKLIPCIAPIYNELILVRVEKIMDVKTVCLGMLTNGESSGYDMKKCFESSFGHFFTAGYGSIYPALASMAEDGLVEYREEPQDGKPDRKVYRVTDKGREVLMQALDNPRPKHKLRSEFLAILCFANLMSDKQLNLLFDNKIAELGSFVTMLDAFGQEKTGQQKDCQVPDGVQFVAGFGRAVAEAAGRYIKDNRHKLALPQEQRISTAAG